MIDHNHFSKRDHTQVINTKVRYQLASQMNLLEHCVLLEFAEQSSSKLKSVLYLFFRWALPFLLIEHEALYCPFHKRANVVPRLRPVEADDPLKKRKNRLGVDGLLL